MVIHTENFDGLTPPANPSDWNISGSFLTETTEFVSSPNSFGLASAATANTPNYANWNTLDGQSGNATVSAYFYCGSNGFLGSTGNQVGLVGRGSAATLNNSSTTQYVAWIYEQPSHILGSVVTIASVVNGAQTNLASSAIGATSAIQSGVWYLLSFTINGTNPTSLSVDIQRYSDGFYWTPGNLWSATYGHAVTYSDASPITGAGYWGLVAQQFQTGNNLAFDDWKLDQISATLASPLRGFMLRGGQPRRRGAVKQSVPTRPDTPGTIIQGPKVRALMIRGGQRRSAGQAKTQRFAPPNQALTPLRGFMLRGGRYTNRGRAKASGLQLNALIGAQSLTVSPNVIPTNATTTIAFLGIGTAWNSGAPTFTATGAPAGDGSWALGTRTVIDDTHATLVVTTGATGGTVVWNDSTDSQKTNQTVMFPGMPRVNVVQLPHAYWMEDRP